MRKFVIKIIVFICIFCLLSLFVFFVTNKFSNFSIDKSKNILVVGHSHSECAYNDLLINGFANYSASGEAYFYTYYKVKKLISQNPQIDCVFIEFSNNQIDKEMDRWIWDDEHMRYNFSRYLPFMDISGLKLLYAKNFHAFLPSIGLSYRKNLIMIYRKLEYNKIIGGYLFLERNKTDSIIADMTIKKQVLYDSCEISQKNIEYLHKIVEYCKSKNSKVFLIRSPLHDKYEGFSNEVLFQKILSTQFSDIEFLDFSKFPLPNSDFADLEHLNHQGAKKYSEWLNGLLKSKLLEMNDKQEYINKEINARVQQAIRRERMGIDCED